MYDTSFVVILDKVTHGCNLCKTLLNYNLLAPMSSNYLQSLSQINDSTYGTPATSVTYTRYYASVKPILTMLIPELHKLLNDEFELQVLNEYGSVKLGVAYFESAIASMSK